MHDEPPAAARGPRSRRAGQGRAECFTLYCACAQTPGSFCVYRRAGRSQGGVEAGHVEAQPPAARNSSFYGKGLHLQSAEPRRDARPQPTPWKDQPALPATDTRWRPFRRWRKGWSRKRKRRQGLWRAARWRPEPGPVVVPARWVSPNCYWTPTSGYGWCCPSSLSPSSWAWSGTTCPSSSRATSGSRRSRCPTGQRCRRAPAPSSVPRPLTVRQGGIVGPVRACGRAANATCLFSSQVLIRSRVLRENGKYIPKQVGSAGSGFVLRKEVTRRRAAAAVEGRGSRCAHVSPEISRRGWGSPCPGASGSAAGSRCSRRHGHRTTARLFPHIDVSFHYSVF